MGRCVKKARVLFYFAGSAVCTHTFIGEWSLKGVMREQAAAPSLGCKHSFPSCPPPFERCLVPL